MLDVNAEEEGYITAAKSIEMCFLHSYVFNQVLLQGQNLLNSDILGWIRCLHSNT